MNILNSLFAKLRQRLFRHRVDFEIFHRIFPHMLQESSDRYPLTTYQEIESATENLDVAGLLLTMEQQASQLPKAYGRAFRYIMHREMHDLLIRYAKVSQRRLPRHQRIPCFVENPS